jgi:hypothetical protein
MGTYSKYKYVNTVFGGDDGIVVPNGSTAQRPTSPVTGTVRYNSDIGLIENFNSNGWASIDVPPIVQSISGTVNENTSSTITITGQNFKSGASITIEGAAVSGASRGLTTTFVNTTTLTANTNASSVTFVGGASFDIRVVNPSGLAGVLSPAGVIDRDPVWSTGAGSLGTISDEFANYSPAFTVSASDPDGGAVTYALSSGSLPAGMSLNTSNGQISGNPSNVSSGTTSSFTLTATSNSQTTARTFSITVNPAADGTSAARAASSANAIKSLTGTTSNGTYWINLPNVGAQQVFCLMENGYNNGGWHLALKSDTGTTFSWGSGYWTGNNTLNTGDINLNNSNAKFDVFNQFVGNDIMARWPDIGQGGCDSHGGNWIWRENGRIGSRSLLSFFQNVSNVNPFGPFSFCGMNGGLWSAQGGMQWYGYNYTINSGNAMRWGFAWNNEGDHGSNDTESGIGSNRAGFSAGDRIYCCNTTTGINRNARIEIYIR